jgi:hypothetical protein
MRAGWKSGSHARSYTWPTGRTAGTGSAAPSRSATAAARSPPRPPPRRPLRHHPRPRTRPLVPRRLLAPPGLSRTVPGRPTGPPGAGRGPQPRAPGRLGDHPDGNPSGLPVTIPLDLDHLPASRRDGRLRAAVTTLISIAQTHGCAAVAVEDLDFAAARDLGREHAGRRPSRGRRGRAWRGMIAGLPTGRFRDRLTQMTANAGLHVIAVDPAYTSRWAAEHWLGPLRDQHQDQVTTGHHAAAVVIGRRAHGHRARRRAGKTGRGQRTAGRRATPEHPSHGSDQGTAGPPRPCGSHPSGTRPPRPPGPARPTRRPTTVRGHPLNRHPPRSVIRNGVYHGHHHPYRCP